MSQPRNYLYFYLSVRYPVISPRDSSQLLEATGRFTSTKETMHLLILSLAGCLPKTDPVPMIDPTSAVPVCSGRRLPDSRCVPSDLPYCDQFEFVEGFKTRQIRLWCLPSNSTSTRVDLPQLIGPDDQPGIRWYTVPDTVNADFVRIGVEDNQVFALIYASASDETVAGTQTCDVVPVRGTNRFMIDRDIPCRHTE